MTTWKTTSVLAVERVSVVAHDEAVGVAGASVPCALAARSSGALRSVRSCPVHAWLETRTQWGRRRSRRSPPQSVVAKGAVVSVGAVLPAWLVRRVQGAVRKLRVRTFHAPGTGLEAHTTRTVASTTSTERQKLTLRVRSQPRRPRSDTGSGTAPGPPGRIGLRMEGVRVRASTRAPSSPLA